jgi:hypothetical protein
MNKQELIESISHLPSDCSGPRPMIDKLTTLELIKLLDETQEVEIPMLVADFITEQKKLSHTLSYSIDACMSDGVAEWYWDDSELFVRAWLDGYTVEKEPKYTVKVKATKQYLSNDEIGPHFDPSFRSNFTKSDLEKLGLGWVFDCEGMEVEKVGK